jgi:hypothetical protein
MFSEILSRCTRAYAERANKNPLWRCRIFDSARDQLPILRRPAGAAAAGTVRRGGRVPSRTRPYLLQAKARAGPPGSVVIHRLDVLDECHGRERQEARHHGHMGEKARKLRMPDKEPADGRCYLQELALGWRQEPRASHFPNFGGGGPSLKLSLCFSSSSSFRRCSSISARMRLDSSCSRTRRSVSWSCSI